MVRMQGNEKVAAIMSLKLNFKEGSQANRIALSMMKRIMQRIQNIQRIRVIRAWREQCQKEATMHNARKPEDRQQQENNEDAHVALRARTFFPFCVSFLTTSAAWEWVWVCPFSASLFYIKVYT